MRRIIVKQDSKIDVAVLVIFFNRPIPFGKVFEQIKKARPSKLFLYQDGPRKDNDQDLEGIQKCRRIAEEIDWECEVHKWYQPENVGCDPSEFIAQKWFFEHVDKGIILEDDDVPAQSFFTFCKELLDKYENDTRIYQISGMNILGNMDEIKESYFFSRGGSIWGWATWKRVSLLWDDSYSFLEDKDVLMKIEQFMENKLKYNGFIQTCKEHKATGKAYYETINYAAKMKYQMLDIVPKYNMISNIGLTPEATHNNVGLDNLPKGIRRVYFMKTNEIPFPLVHPDQVIENFHYLKRLNRILAWGHPIVTFYRVSETRLYKFKNAKKGERKELFISYMKRKGNKVEKMHTNH
jgi:hypothetical protein